MTHFLSLPLSLSGQRRIPRFPPQICSLTNIFFLKEKSTFFSLTFFSYDEMQTSFPPPPPPHCRVKKLKARKKFFSFFACVGCGREMRVWDILSKQLLFECPVEWAWHLGWIEEEEEKVGKKKCWKKDMCASRRRKNLNWWRFNACIAWGHLIDVKMCPYIGSKRGQIRTTGCFTPNKNYRPKQNGNLSDSKMSRSEKTLFLAPCRCCE